MTQSASSHILYQMGSIPSNQERDTRKAAGRGDGGMTRTLVVYRFSVTEDRLSPFLPISISQYILFLQKQVCVGFFFFFCHLWPNTVVNLGNSWQKHYICYSKVKRLQTEKQSLLLTVNLYQSSLGTQFYYTTWGQKLVFK